MLQSNSFLQIAKGPHIAFRAIAKDNHIPFRANCRRNLPIACNADNVGNIPLGAFNLKFKKWRQLLKFCLTSAFFVPIRACSTIPLSGRSNLVRRYLKTQQYNGDYLWLRNNYYNALLHSTTFFSLIFVFLNPSYSIFHRPMFWL